MHWQALNAGVLNQQREGGLECELACVCKAEEGRVLTKLMVVERQRECCGEDDHDLLKSPTQ